MRQSLPFVLIAAKGIRLFMHAGGAEFGWAGNRTRQNNPFLYDNFNYLNIGAFLGATWNLNHSAASIGEQEYRQKGIACLGVAIAKTQIKLEAINAYEDVLLAQSHFAAVQSRSRLRNRGVIASTSFSTMALVIPSAL
jgi:hypothetical protein